MSARLESSQPQASSCLLCIGAGIADVYRESPACYVGDGIQTPMVFTIVEQAILSTEPSLQTNVYIFFIFGKQGVTLF